MGEKIKFKIQKASKNDIPQILDNWKQLMRMHVHLWPKFYKMKVNAEKIYLKFLKKQMKRRNATVFVAKSRDCVIGHAMVQIAKVPPVYKINKQCEVCEIFVKKGFRKKGIGAALFKAVEEWARRNGTRQISLKVDVKNKDARSLYENLGYKTHRLGMVKII